MTKARTFMLLGLLVCSMALVTGCCGFDPCDPLPNPCASPCDDPCGGAAPAPAAAPAAPAANSCGGGKSCG